MWSDGKSTLFGVRHSKFKYNPYVNGYKSLHCLESLTNDSSSVKWL